jgi:uncharacterized membrane protein YeaQ/YmgE (transglycosylase-associated protein family)
MSILLFLVFGFIAGLIARAIMPGPQPMGLVMTTVLGVVGSFVGGLLASLVFGYGIIELRATGLIGSVLGALVVMALASIANGRAARA